MNNPGLYLLPTYGRVELLKRFFRAYEKTKATLPGRVILAAEDPCLEQYLAFRLPFGWEYFIQGNTEEEPVRCFAASIRGWMGDHREWVARCKWMGFVTDDQVPESEAWDRRIVDTLGGNVHIVSSNDLWQISNCRMVGAQVHSGAILRAVGYFFPPKFRHLYIDDIWEGIGRATGTWVTRSDIIVRHYHHLNPVDPAPFDKTYQDSGALYEHDGALYREWLLEERGAVLRRVDGILK